MGRGYAETHLDSDYSFRGKHKGADGGLVLLDRGACFESCGAIVGAAIYNDTDVSNGLITAVTEDTITCTLAGGTNNTWSNLDQYSVFKTSSKDSLISSISTDKRFGNKALSKDELEDGLFPEDRDLDEKGEEVWSPGFPEHVGG